MTNSGYILDKEIILLSEYFLRDKKDNTSSSFSLFGGIAGSVLVQSILFQLTSDPKYKTRIEDNLEKMTNLVEESNNLSPTFCDGLAGVGWLFLYLNEKKIVEIDPDEFLMDTDEFLKESVDVFLLKKNYDILHGVLGMGLYFLKRGNILEVEKIIRQLYEDCDKSNNEVKLATIEITSNQKIYNLGLAHGQASLLYFLGKCYTKNIMSELCEKMIYGIINFYFNHLQDKDNNKSFFPTIIPYNFQQTAKKNWPPRLAWCYGDLGVLYTVLQLSKWLNDHSLYRKAEDMLIEVSKRRDLTLAMLEDAQFCHGTSGVAYIFLNLYRITGNIIFQETAQFWKKVVVAMGQNEDNGLLGYLFSVGQNKKLASAKFLTGIGGVMASLLSFEDNGLGDWDECLFLS